MLALCLLFWRSSEFVIFGSSQTSGTSWMGLGPYPAPLNETRVVMSAAVRANLVREFFMVADNC